MKTIREQGKSTWNTSETISGQAGTRFGNKNAGASFESEKKELGAALGSALRKKTGFIPRLRHQSYRRRLRFPVCPLRLPRTLSSSCSLRLFFQKGIVFEKTINKEL